MKTSTIIRPCDRDSLIFKHTISILIPGLLPFDSMIVIGKAPLGLVSLQVQGEAMV